MGQNFGERFFSFDIALITCGTKFKRDLNFFKS